MKHITPVFLFALAACGSHKTAITPPEPPLEPVKSYASSYSVTGTSDCGPLNANWVVVEDANGITVDTAPDTAFVQPAAAQVQGTSLVWTQYQVEDYSGCQADRTLAYVLTGAPGEVLHGSLKVTESATCSNIHTNNCTYALTASPAKD